MPKTLRPFNQSCFCQDLAQELEARDYPRYPQRAFWQALEVGELLDRLRMLRAGNNGDDDDG